MKITFVFCCLVFSMSLGVHAQTFISFSAGPNFPGGDLAARDTESLGSGFAKTGIALDLSAGKLLYKKLGLVATVRYQRNDFDEETRKIQAAITADPWQSWNVSIGPCLEFKVLSKLVIGMNVQGGYYRTSERTLNFTGPYSIVDVDQEAAGAFSVLYGLNVRYELNDHLGIGINADYFTSTQSFSAKYGLQNLVNGYDESSHREYKMDMQSTNVQISVSYTFK